MPGRAGSQEAVDAARAMQSRIDGARHRGPGGDRMTFIELVVEHYLPLQGDLSRVTGKNIASHLGDATGQLRAKVVKDGRAARYLPKGLLVGLRHGCARRSRTDEHNVPDGSIPSGT